MMDGVHNEGGRVAHSAPLAPLWLLSNESHGITSDFMAVEHVETAEPVDGLAGKPAQWNDDEEAMERFDHLTPACPRGNGRDEDDMGFPRMQRGGGNEAFFQRLREAQGRVFPDIRNRPRRKEK